MAQVITKEAEALIGQEFPLLQTEVEVSWVQHFAHSIAWPNPPNPLYFDEEYARKGPFGGIIAPPTFATRVKWMGLNIMEFCDRHLGPCTVMMNGGNEYEFLEPIRPGDVLTGTGRLASLKESTRPDGGALVIVRFAGRVENQRGQRVLNTAFALLRVYGKDQVRQGER